MVGGQDRKNLTAHLDVLPTLAELCGLEMEDSLPLDGISFAEHLTDSQAKPHRDHVVVQLHGGTRNVNPDIPWSATCVLYQNWRLLDGEKLYDVKNDPSQHRELSEKKPEMVAKLRSLYEMFWVSVSPRLKIPVCLDIGNPVENPTFLCSQDWRLPVGNPPWNFGTISSLPKITGPWHVDVKQAGKYRFSLRQFPKEANKVVKAVRANIKIAGITDESEVRNGEKVVVFELDLPKGKTKLETFLHDEKGRVGGAYFTEVELLK